MAAGLILSADLSLGIRLEELLQEQSWRTRTVLEIEHAKSWIERSKLDLLLLDSEHVECDTVSIAQLAQVLWKGSELARVVVIGDEGLELSDLKLDGIEIVAREAALESIKAILLQVESLVPIHPRKILVVEDLDAPRDIICDYVERFGCGAVTGVASAREALEKLSQDNDWCCIITDQRMPEISGQQLIEQIRGNPKTRAIPIIVLTAHGTASTLVGCLKSGATGFLIKPPKKAELQRELAKALRIKSYKLSPRLSSVEEAEQIREMLINRGFID